MAIRIVTLVISFIAALPAFGTTYYVSPTGNNNNNGLTIATAWASLDNGDQKGILVPGDTINIIPGSYTISTSYELTTSGTAGQKIVYRKLGKGPVKIDGQTSSNSLVLIEGNHIVVDGLELSYAKDDAIHITSDSCLVTNCNIYLPDRRGIRVEGNYNLFLRNVIAFAGEDGIKNEDAGKESNSYYNNTIYQCGKHGIELNGNVKTARIFNNIVAQCSERGVVGPLQNVCAFNNVWGNLGGNYSGVFDSAGGISVQPRLVNPAGGRFDLMHTAAEIDAGLDLGYPYNGAATDIGAREKYNVYYVSPSGDDANDGLSPTTSWHTIDNGDSLLFPGDTVYIMAGTYSDSVMVTDSGLSDDRIVFLGVRDSTLVDAATAGKGVVISGSYVQWAGISVADANETDLYLSGNHILVEEARVTGAGTYGLHLSSADSCTLFRVTCFESISADVRVDVPVVEIYHCTFYSSGIYSVDAPASIGARLVNNIFRATESTTTAVRAPITATLRYSSFYNHSQLVEGGVVLGAGCFIADPLFVNPDSGNFRLDSFSPAIDAGTDLGYDFHGLLPDLGAYETGVLVDLEITPLYDSLFADSSYQFTVIASDSVGNPAKPGNLQWTHTFSTGSINSSGVFTPQLVGSGRIIVISTTFGVVDTSALLSVVPGSLSSLHVSPNRDTISADSIRQFTASGQDNRGNAVSDLGNLTWSVLNGIGTISGGGLFYAGKAGQGFIRVTSDLGVSGISDTITVIAGEPASIDVVPDVNIVVEDSSCQYHAYSYDSDNNLVSDLTLAVAWSTTDPSGSIDNSGLYTAGTNPSPPVYWIHAVYDSLVDSGKVSVISSGTLSYIQVELADGRVVPDTTLTTNNDTTRLYCRGYDSGDNLLGDVAVSWSVIGNDSIGNVTPQSGPSTKIILSRIGMGQVVAEYSPSIMDSTGIITCLAGEPANVIVTPDSAAISADSSLQFSIELRDADGNLTGSLSSVQWSVIGAIGSIDTSGYFEPMFSGTGSVVAKIGSLADTASPITVVPGQVVSIEISPDSAVVSADTAVQFTATGYDSKGNEQFPGQITWSLTAAVGLIDSSGLFDATAVGTAQVVGLSDLGFTDSSTFLEVIAGRLNSLTISPNSVELTTDSIVTFAAAGVDTDGNSTGVGSLTWSLLNGIGEISSSGTFTAVTTGTDRVIVTSSIDDVTDTNRAVVVTPGILDRLHVSPDTATTLVGDTIQFTATGYDRTLSETSVGTLTWSVTGGIGTIDTTGLFVAGSSGTGRIIASSNIGGVSDSTGPVIVEALRVQSFPLTSQIIYPGEVNKTVLVFEIANDFATDKTVHEITLRDYSRGPGTHGQRLANMDSVSLYVDSDRNFNVSGGDILLSTTLAFDTLMPHAFTPLTISAFSDVTIMAVIHAALFPRDGDSLDLIVLPSQDIQTGDGTTVEGPDTVNSQGVKIVDGMVAEQLTVASGGVTLMSSADSMYHLLSIDIPRNGYESDTLKALSLTNLGNASDIDMDSLLLYADDGNGSWDGPAVERRLGRLVFTGELWTRSGLALPLVGQTTRVYVAAVPSTYPRQNATIVWNLPQHGVTVISANDGPLDAGITVTDTTYIESEERFLLETATISGGHLFPGNTLYPVTGFTLTNAQTTPVDLDSLVVTLYAGDPRGATQSELDSQVDSVVLLYNGDGKFGVLGLQDTVIATGTFTDARVTFPTPGLRVGATGGVLQLTFALRLNDLLARDGNPLNMGIAEASDIYSTSPTALSCTFPAKNPDDFVIDAFSAASVITHPRNATTHFGGQTDRVVFDLELPGNGYADDTLVTLKLDNQGTIDDFTALTSVKLWHDRTGNGFTADDELVNEFEQRLFGWEATDVFYPMRTGRTRLLVTVDVTAEQFEGGTLVFSVPTGGVVYRSGMSGPDDVPIVMTESHLVVPSNRITAVSIPIASTIVAPGSENNAFMTFALYNGYHDQSKILQSVRLRNVSRTISSADFVDGELGQLSLYLDVNGNRLLDGDSLLATGRFTDGVLRFSGFNATLPSESLSYFFLQTDLPLIVTDGDSLAIEVSGASDLGFADVVSINGDLPLSSGNFLVIDGSILAQYENLPLQPRTISPGDTSVTLLAFRPAANGERTDTLTALSVKNLLSADTADVASMELWLDDNLDGAWQSTDRYLGEFSFLSGTWTISDLSVEVVTDPPALFVIGDITTGARPDAAVQLQVPIDGCQYASNNDGPRDAPLSSLGSFTVSASALKLSLAPLKASYSVGQPITVSFTCTNMLSFSIDSVIGEVVAISDSNLITEDNVSAGPVTLAAMDSAGFTFTYTATQAGTVSWDVRAVARMLPDSSAVVSTPEVCIQNGSSGAELRLINSMPTAVTRAQKNVFPLSLVIKHPDTTTLSASLRLDTLRVFVEDANGVGQLAGDVFSRMALSTQYAILTILETMPADSVVLLVFDQPVVIEPLEQRRLTLLVDIDTNSAATDFVLSIPNPAAVPVVDYNTLQPVSFSVPTNFPLKTASCRIDDPSEQLAVSTAYAAAGPVNLGQRSVRIVQMNLSHPGDAGQSQIQLASLSLAVIDGAGDTVRPAAFFEAITLTSQEYPVGRVSGDQLETVKPLVHFSSPVTISPGGTAELTIVCDISNSINLGAFRIVVPDSNCFIARDLSSGSLIDVVTDTLQLATGSVFPIESGMMTLKRPAQPPEICFGSLLPTSVVGGIDSLPLIQVTVNYPVDSTYSSLRITRLSAVVLDSSGTPLDPDRLLDRIGYRLGSGTVQYQAFVELFNGATVFRMSDTGIMIQPGVSTALSIIADIESDVPYDNFTLTIASPTALSLYDATDTTHDPGFEPLSGCSLSYPFIAGPTDIFLPAGRPIVVVNPLPAQLAFPGQQGVSIFRTQMSYSDEIAQGDLSLAGLSGAIYKRTKVGIESANGQHPFEVVKLYLGQQVIAIDSSVSGDSIRLLSTAGPTIAAGFSNELSIGCDITEDAAPGNYVIVFNDSTYMDISDRQLATRIFPVLQNADYPLMTAEVSVLTAGLQHSFTNYPNPFFPSRGEITTIGYVLPEDAQVDIEIFTISGDAVRAVATNAFKAAGAHQEDVWAGQNDHDRQVLSGTYYCQITAHYSSGRVETYRRKIAVVR
jgi:hypothetical protein